MAKKKEILTPVVEQIAAPVVVDIPVKIANEMQIFKPEEYNLDTVQANEISEAFRPKLIEMNQLIPEYTELIKQETTPETAKQAKELRLKLVKIRTGTEKIHKEQKEKYLKPGKFVDAWRTAQQFASEEMESELTAKEKHFERLEEIRKEALNKERKDILIALGETNVSVMRYGDLLPDVWENYLSGLKLSIEAKKEADKAKAEADAEAAKKLEEENEKLRKDAEERAANDKLHNDRLKTLMSVSGFLPSGFDFTELHKKEPEFLKKTYTDAKALFDAEKAKKTKDEENLKLHNERLHLLRPVMAFLPEDFKLVDLHLETPAHLNLIYKSAKSAFDLAAKAKAQEEADKKAKEEADKKLAESSDKTRLNAWLDAVKLPAVNMQTLSPESQKAVTEIEVKFVNFKAWALKQIG